MTKEDLKAAYTSFSDSCKERKDMDLHLAAMVRIIGAIVKYLLTKKD